MSKNRRLISDNAMLDLSPSLTGTPQASRPTSTPSDVPAKSQPSNEGRGNGPDATSGKHLSANRLLAQRSAACRDSIRETDDADLLWQALALESDGGRRRTVMAALKLRLKELGEGGNHLPVRNSDQPLDQPLSVRINQAIEDYLMDLDLLTSRITRTKKFNRSALVRAMLEMVMDAEINWEQEFLQVDADEAPEEVFRRIVHRALCQGTT